MTGCVARCRRLGGSPETLSATRGNATPSRLICTNHKAGFIDETPAAGWATAGLAEPFALMKHKAARFAASGFHQQAIGARMQTFPDMVEMRKHVFFRDSQQGGNVFG